MERTRRYRVRSLIRVDASAQDADEFLDMVRMTWLNNVAIHGKVFLEEAHFIVHIRKETSYLGRKMDYVGWFYARKERLDNFQVGKTSINLSRREIKSDCRYNDSESPL